MKSNIAKISTLLATFSIPLAGMLVADTTSIQVGAGYRQDHISWDLKDHGIVNARHKSNLDFKDIEIAFIEVSGKTSLGCCPGYARIAFDYGWIFDGSLREQIEIEREDSFSEFSDAFIVEGEYLDITLHNDVKHSSFVWDFDVALAYPINCWCDELIIAPAIGFSYNRQHIRVRDDVAVQDASISSSDETCSDSSGFCIDADDRGRSSRYRASWWGPWIGFDFAYVSCDCWSLYGDLEFHFGRVRRQRNSNSGVDFFDHYTRTKNFWGPTFHLGTSYIICENWFVDAVFEYNKWWSDNCRDDLTWTSASIRLDLGYMF